MCVDEPIYPLQGSLLGQVVTWNIFKRMYLLRCFVHNQLCAGAFLWQPTSSDEPKNK